MLVLRPSAIHGVGVHTTSPIPKRGHVRLWQSEDWRFVTFAEAERDPDVWAMRDVYCVTDGTGYHCPLDFHRMSIGWYMNHSDNPNVHFRDKVDYEYFALRDIVEGEEILCNYRTLTPYESAP